MTQIQSDKKIPMELFELFLQQKPSLSQMILKMFALENCRRTAQVKRINNSTERTSVWFGTN